MDSSGSRDDDRTSPLDGSDRGESPLEREDQEVGAEAATDPDSFLGILPHFYRGEVSQASGAQDRIDRTTDWAIALLAALLSLVFSSRCSRRNSSGPKRPNSPAFRGSRWQQCSASFSSAYSCSHSGRPSAGRKARSTGKNSASGRTIERRDALGSGELSVGIGTGRRIGVRLDRPIVLEIGFGLHARIGHVGRFVTGLSA